jgi:hypothetical protein
VKALTPEQRVRFKTLHDRWLQDIQKNPPPPHQRDE